MLLSGSISKGEQLGQESEGPRNLAPSKNKWKRDFPGGPVAKIPCSHCRGPGFNC